MAQLPQRALVVTKLVCAAAALAACGMATLPKDTAAAAWPPGAHGGGAKPAWPDVPWRWWQTWAAVAAVYGAFMSGGWLAAALAAPAGWGWLATLLAAQLLTYALAALALAPLLMRLRRAVWVRWLPAPSVPVIGATAAGLVLSLAAGLLLGPVGRGRLSLCGTGLVQPELLAVAELSAARCDGSPAVLVALGGLVAPLWEEAFFRGFLVTALVRGQPSPWRCAEAVMLSSLAFGCFHCQFGLHGSVNLRPLLPTAALGAIFGGLFVRTRSLPVVVLIHLLWNTAHFVLVAVLVRAGASAWAVERAAQCYA